LRTFLHAVPCLSKLIAIAQSSDEEVRSTRKCGSTRIDEAKIAEQIEATHWGWETPMSMTVTAKPKSIE
jgi:hypothetical protein